MARTTTIGVVSDILRFPVKSLGGERLERVFVDTLGLRGDRRWSVVDEAGATRSARRHRTLLGFRARYADSDAATGLEIIPPAGPPADFATPGLADALTAAVAARVTLVRSATSAHDAAPVHLVSARSLTALGTRLGGEVDCRRFRANVVVAPTAGAPFTEPSWVGRELRVGERGPVLRVVSATERCVVPTIDPDSLERWSDLQRVIAAERENVFGVYAEVVAAGWVSSGDAVSLAPA